MYRFHCRKWSEIASCGSKSQLQCTICNHWIVDFVIDIESNIAIYCGTREQSCQTMQGWLSFDHCQHYQALQQTRWLGLRCNWQHRIYRYRGIQGWECLLPAWPIALQTSTHCLLLLGAGCSILRQTIGPMTPYTRLISLISIILTYFLLPPSISSDSC